MHKLFLIKLDNGQEAMMKLPVGQHGGITQNGFKLIHERFNSSLKYALMLEAYSSSDSLLKAIKNYQNNTI